MLRTDRPFDRKDTIEMVDFVLQQLRKSTFCPQAFPLTAFVDVGNLDPCVATYADEKVGK